MDNFFKILLVVLVLAYIISPADLMPGPIDDVIVTLLGVILGRKTTAKQ